MNFECWATDAWAAGSWVDGSWCPGGAPPQSGGGTLPRYATTRTVDLLQPRYNKNWERLHREDEEIVIL
jgi:hypothetical protein